MRDQPNRATVVSNSRVCRTRLDQLSRGRGFVAVPSVAEDGAALAGHEETICTATPSRQLVPPPNESRQALHPAVPRLTTTRLPCPETDLGARCDTRTGGEGPALMGRVNARGGNTDEASPRPGTEAPVKSLRSRRSNATPPISSTATVPRPMRSRTTVLKPHFLRRLRGAFPNMTPRSTARQLSPSRRGRPQNIPRRIGFGPPSIQQHPRGWHR